MKRLAAVAAVTLAAAFIPAGTAHASTQCVSGTFGPGSSGQCVKDIQGLLDGAMPFGLAADGQYGPATYNAVRWFQAVTGIDPMSYYPGTVAYWTWDQLCYSDRNAPFGSATFMFYINAGCATFLSPV